jgi:Holliday junction resolvase-like predicted endonuclease
MATVLDIVRGMSQAAANAYDGGHNEKYSLDGEERKIGLKREEGDPIIDSRVIDGFGVRMSGPILTVSYQSDIKLKDVYAGDIEAEVDDMIENVVKFLKKEYKKITGDSLSLNSEGEVDVLVQNTSKVRVFVTGKKNYRVGNLDGVLEVREPSEDRLDKSIRDFLALGKNN